MRKTTIEDVSIRAVHACVPSRAVSATDVLRPLLGEKTEATVRSVGIGSLRLADPGVTPLDLCLASAESVFARCGIRRDEVGVVVFVSLTEPTRMPSAAVRAQAKLGLSADTLAFDVSMACSGWICGLYLAASLARQLGRAVLLLDGDVQSARLDPQDAGTRAVMSDAGSATVVAPEAGKSMEFAFLSDGAKGGALTLGGEGVIRMNGLEVFRFVATEVADFLKAFGTACAWFAPHQANVYLVRQLARTLGIDPDRTLVSADRFGNPGSASVPLTLADAAKTGVILAAAFGGGLSAGAARFELSENVDFRRFDFVGNEESKSP